MQTKPAQYTQIPHLPFQDPDPSRAGERAGNSESGMCERAQDESHSGKYMLDIRMQRRGSRIVPISSRMSVAGPEP